MPMHYDEITGNMVEDGPSSVPPSYRPERRGPPGQGNGGHLEPLTGERAEEEEDFIAGIGRWFEDNGQTMPAFLSLAVLAIIASIIVFSVVQTWRSGDPVSAIIVAIIFGFLAVRGYLIALGILYGCFWLIFFVGRFLFKSTYRFAIIVMIFVGIHYFSTHQEAQEALSALVDFVQSWGESQLR